MNLHGTRDADASRAPLIIQVSVWIVACVRCRRRSSRTCNLIIQKSLVKQKMNEKKKNLPRTRDGYASRAPFHRL